MFKLVLSFVVGTLVGSMIRGSSSTSLGLQGTYVDKRGLTWQLATFIAPGGDMWWEGRETSTPCFYMYTNGDCPHLVGPTQNAVIVQIDSLVALYMKGGS